MGPGEAADDASLPAPWPRGGKASAVPEAAGSSEMETRASSECSISSRVFQRPTPHCCVAAFVVLLMTVCSVESRSYDVSYGSGSTQENLRITCYTCMNVSTNEECNRFAIDRPCPEGRDYCLTLHVMDGLELDRSVLVNKRCAFLDECTGDSTGCTAADGQTQCVSCCDKPYCNDYVPSNETSALFHRSSAGGALRGAYGSWRLAAMLATALALSSWPT